MSPPLEGREEQGPNWTEVSTAPRDRAAKATRWQALQKEGVR